MPFDLDLAERLRRSFVGRAEVAERRMFGGLAFMVDGHMACGIAGDRLMVRVGPAAYETALGEPHVGPMDLTGRPLRGFVLVTADGVENQQQVDLWVAQALEFVMTLPAK